MCYTILYFIEGCGCVSKAGCGGGTSGLPREVDVRGRYKAVDEKREQGICEGERVIKRAMGWRRKAVTNYCRLRGGKVVGEQDLSEVRGGERDTGSHNVPV